MARFSYMGTAVIAVATASAMGCNWVHGSGSKTFEVVVVDSSSVADVDVGRTGGADADAAAPEVTAPCPATCTDGNLCTEDWCDPVKGGCIHANTANPCDDGDGCTLGDSCAAGNCTPGKAMVCDDGNACSDDACKGGMCVFLANAATCSDGNACTQGDACAGLGCTGGKPTSCDDGVACTDDSCAPATGKCVTAANQAVCDDGDGCTQGDACAAGNCTPGKALVCNDGNACSDDACKGGVCVFLANAATCSDGNACTQGDACAGLGCKAGKAVGCDDGNVCTVEACDFAKGCTATAAKDGGGCDDGTACTTGDSCKAGTCGAGTFAFAESVVAEKPIAAIATLPDGLVIAGTTKGKDGTASFYVQAFGPAQNTKWAYADANSAEDYAWAVARLPEGTIATAGERRPAASTKWDGLVVVLDQSGKKLAERTMGNASGNDDVFYAVAAAGPNTIALAGVTQVPVGGADLWLTVVNATGTPNTAFDVHFGGPDIDGGVSVVQVADGGFAVAGTTKSKGAGFHDFWLIRTDAKGHKIWDRTYGGAVSDLAAAVISVQGGFALVGMTQSFGIGTTDDAWLIRVDEVGNLLWSKTIGGATKDHARGIVQVAGGFVLAGYASSIDGTPNLALWRTDDLGNLQWTKEVPAPGLTDTATGIAAVANGLATVGLRGTADPKVNDGWLLRTDAFGNVTCSGAGVCAAKAANDCDDGKPCTADDCEDGKGCASKPLPNGAPCDDGKPCTTSLTCQNEACAPQPGKESAALFYRTYPATGGVGGQASEVVAYAGGYILGGTGVNSAVTGYDAWLLRTDSAGNVVWQKTFATADYDNFAAVVVASAGLAATGQTGANGNLPQGISLLVVDYDTGEVKVQTSFDGGKQCNGRAIVEPADGGYLIAAESTGQSIDGRLIRTDGAGKVKWDKLYGGSKADYAYDVEPVGDGFVVAGRVESKGYGDADVWLFKVDAAGVVVWERTFGDQGFQAASVNSLARLADGIVVAGQKCSQPQGQPNSCKGWLIATDAYGNPIWTTTFDAPPGGLVDAVRVTSVSDGGLGVAVGAHSKYEFGKSLADQFTVHRLDGLGNTLWQQPFKATPALWPASIVAVADGFAIAGAAPAVGKPGTTALLVRLDTFGNKNCADAGNCADASVQTCADGNPCTVDSCAKGKCDNSKALAKLDGTAAECDDNDACTAAAVCAGGSCKATLQTAFWSKAFGPSNGSNVRSIEPVDGGEFLVAGMTGAGPNVGYAFVTRRRADFSEVWHLDLGTTAYHSVAADVIHVPESNGYSAALVESKGAGWKKLLRQTATQEKFVIDLGLKTGSSFGVGAAYVFLPGGGEVAIVSTNADKAESWDWDAVWRVVKSDGGFSGAPVNYSSGKAEAEFVYDAVALPTRRVAWAGSRGGRPWLAVIDPEKKDSPSKGVEIDKTYEVATPQDSYAASIVAMADGGFALAGVVRPFATTLDAALWVGRTNVDGKLLWAKVYGASIGGSAFGSSMVSDGSALFVAGRNNTLLGSTDQNHWLMKVDFSGSAIWSRTWGSSGDEGLAALAVVPGAILVGGNHPDTSALIARLDPWGNPTCTACAGLAPADCDDANAKTLDLCDPAKGCVHLPQ